MICELYGGANTGIGSFGVTDATLMLKEGVHPKVVSERLGHASVVITLDTYSHVLPGLQEEAALKFEQGLRNVAFVGPESQD